MSKPYPDHEDGSSDRYERLEELLRQTLTLAGEIAEDEGRTLTGECIIVRRRSNSDPTGGNRQDIRSRLLKRRKALKFDESEDSQSQSQSPASSVQEPFSPGSLAVSLDAVVEKGKTSDNDLTPAHESPQGSPTRSRTPKSHQNSDTVLKKSQKIEGERSKGENTAANQPSPPNWHIRIVPVTSSRDSGSPAPSSPTLMKLEAVFPLKASTEGNATSSLECNGEPSCILISRQPMDSSPESPRPRVDGEDILAAQEKSLREIIHEWQYDAESPGVEERKL
ncbi:hypothetical protein SLS63_007793 [Diaporthe eres]|uniref:Uncharacterized protein n=1 Tax=Diaporthe eres TaxID=83184 RepID=A0ABR1P4B4_DIAER